MIIFDSSTSCKSVDDKECILVDDFMVEWRLSKAGPMTIASLCWQRSHHHPLRVPIWYVFRGEGGDRRGGIGRDCPRKGIDQLRPWKRASLTLIPDIPSGFLLYLVLSKLRGSWCATHPCHAGSMNIGMPLTKSITYTQGVSEGLGVWACLLRLSGREFDNPILTHGIFLP